MLVAAIQFRPERGEVERNRNKLLLLLSQAGKANPELIVLPEMCTTGYIFREADEVRPHCEERGGKTERLFSAEAARIGATICYGWAELDPADGRLYNSATICFPDRSVLYYRKNLLYDADETWATPGDTPYPVWRSPSGYLCSLGICMDLNDERFVQHLKKAEIRVVAFPTNWLDQGFKVWPYWAWRLEDTKACLVAGNRYGTEDDTTFCGDSAVLDGRTLLGWTEERADTVVLALIPPEPTPSPVYDHHD